MTMQTDRNRESNKVVWEHSYIELDCDCELALRFHSYHFLFFADFQYHVTKTEGMD